VSVLLEIVGCLHLQFNTLVLNLCDASQNPAFPHPDWSGNLSQVQLDLDTAAVNYEYLPPAVHYAYTYEYNGMPTRA
jgi:hypothetical protein